MASGNELTSRGQTVIAVFRCSVPENRRPTGVQGTWAVFLLLVLNQYVWGLGHVMCADEPVDASEEDEILQRGLCLHDQ
jgi:hypothetical protein